MSIARKVDDVNTDSNNEGESVTDNETDEEGLAFAVKAYPGVR